MHYRYELPARAVDWVPLAVMAWASILGFIDVMALMLTAVWLAHRHQRRAGTRAAGVRPTATGAAGYADRVTQ